MATIVKKNYNRLSDVQIANDILNGELNDIEKRKEVLGDRYEAVQKLVTNRLIMQKKITSPKKGEDAIIKDIAEGKWGDSEEENKKRLNLLGFSNEKEILNKVKILQEKKYKEIAEKFNNKEVTYSQLLNLLEQNNINYDKIQPFMKEHSSEIQKGDYVQIKRGAKDTKTGKTLPDYIIQSKYLVKKVNKKTVVIGDVTKEMGVIDKSFIIKQ